MADEPREPDPWRDPIVAEVRETREALYAEAGYDIYELCRRLQERQKSAGAVVTRASGS
jgi:hypothetical protein